MYAHRVIERNIRTVEKGSNLKFSRYEYGISEEWSKHIQSLWIEADKRTSRPLTTEEAKFVQNEQILCQLDFRYWAERYCVIRYDGAVGGGIGKMRLGDAQELLLKLISRIQDKQYAAVDRGGPVRRHPDRGPQGPPGLAHCPLSRSHAAPRDALSALEHLRGFRR